jgi:hypothetical protein
LDFWENLSGGLMWISRKKLAQIKSEYWTEAYDKGKNVYDAHIIDLQSRLKVQVKANIELQDKIREQNEADTLYRALQILKKELLGRI